ncbi:MAG TPA: hypothetical protein VNN07_08200 [Candidatus Tectomicrobia bacterium]|nr:hypothetical protein [Candidatus Tectomicrobia bacterium]
MTALPADGYRDPMPAEAEDPEALPTPTRVLVVDERLEMRVVLCRYVASRGMVAVPAVDAGHAEMLARRLGPAVALIGLALADKPAVLVRLLKDRRPDLRIVVCTDDVADATACKAEGAEAIVPPPLDVDRLDGVLARLAAPAPSSFS